MITCHPVSRYFSRSLVSLVFLATAALELQGAEDTNPPMSQPTDGPTWTEMSGNRFRRIRLDGIPIPAEKGQAKSETDEESEESYVDSLTQAFRHDTSDIYVPLPGGELSLAVKRSSQPEVWAYENGEWPMHWRSYTRPFGLGWSSGLCPNLRGESYTGSGTLPHDIIDVTDENGSTYRFTQIFKRDGPPPADPAAPVDIAFLPLPSNRTSSDSFRNRLTARVELGTDGKRRVTSYVFTRKFGTTLTFDPYRIVAPSVNGSSSVTKTVVYFRLSDKKSIVDRFGNQLTYTYPTSDSNSLIPSSIEWRNSSDTVIGSKTLTINSSSNLQYGRKIDSIRDHKGNTWYYGYESRLLNGHKFYELKTVTPPVGGVVTYTYETPSPVLDERQPAPATPPATPEPRRNYQHFSLQTITTGGGMVRMPGGTYTAWTGPARTTSIEYDWDNTVLSYDPPNSTYFNPYASRPRIVKSTTLPGGGGATFTNSGPTPTTPGATPTTPGNPVKLVAGGTGTGLAAVFSVQGKRELKCIDAEGAPRTFTYSQENLVNFNEIEDLFYGTTGDALRNPYVAILWTQCDLTHPDAKKETVVFDKDAALADKQVTDYSGNVTSYEYGDIYKVRWFIPWLPPVVDSISLFSPRYTDPTKETRTLLGGSPVVKQFRYYSSGHGNGGTDVQYHLAPASRVMTQITDGLSRVTDYVVDSATGRRETETIKEASGAVIKETVFTYTDPRFRGFVTGTRVKDAVRANGVIRDIYTTSTPDAAGNPFSQTVDPGGLNLTTSAQFDDNNNKLSETDARNSKTDFVYDDANRLVRTILPAASLADGSLQAAAILDRGYTPTGKVFWSNDARGTVTLTQYDARDRATATAQATLTATNLVPSSNALIPAVLPVGTIKTSSVIDKLGRIRTSTDARGTITTTDYDVMQRPWRVTQDPTGLNLVTTYSYTGLNTGGGAFANSTFKPTSTVSPRGFSTTVTYDGLYRPVTARTQFEAGKYSYSKRFYDAAGNETERHVWREALTATSLPSTSALITKTTYDALNRPLVVTEGLGTTLETVTTTTYDAAAAWRVVKSDGGIVKNTQTDYDAAGRATHMWSPSALNGLVDRTSWSDPKLGSGVSVTQYDPNGNVITAVDVLGHVTRTVFDQRNRAYRVAVNHLTGNPAIPSGGVPPLGDLVTSTLYDQVGNSLSVTDPRGFTTACFFDRANRKTAVSTPTAPIFGASARPLVSSSEYDPNGNITLAVDTAGAATRNVYDRANRLTDSAVNDATGLPGNPATAPLPGDIVTRNQYDKESNLTRVTDGLGQVTEFTYDGLKRKTSVIWDALDLTRRKSDQIAIYDGLLQTSLTDARSRVMNFYYDARLRPSGIECVGTSTDSRTMILDRAGRVTRVLHGGYTLPVTTVLTANVRHVGMAYDFLDRVLTETSAGVTHGYEWDKGGNRTLVTYGVTGRFIVSEYDKLNRLKLLTEKLPAESIPRVTRYDEYDGNGNLLKKIHGNATTEVTTYDSLNRRETHQVRAGSTVLSNFGFFYDAASNVARIVESYDPTAGIAGRTVTNLYDFTRRLKLETSVDAARTVATTYVYDAANNRTDKSVATTPAGGSTTTEPHGYSYGNAANGYNSNQLGTWTKPGGAQVTYTYDLNGNRETRSETLGGVVKTDTYSWDYWNRLSRLAVQSKVGTPFNGTYTYDYDHRSRRVMRREVNGVVNGGKRVISSYSGGTSVQERAVVEPEDALANADYDQYVNLLEYAFGYDPLNGSNPYYSAPGPYDNWARVAIRERMSDAERLAYISANSTLEAEYVRGSDWGGGVGGILYTARGSVLSWAHYNGRGDVTVRSSATGALTYAASYEAYGTRTQEAGANADRQRANTKDEDPTDLLNEGFRYRDLETGLFISRDPMGFVDGPNVYTYVRQNPWTKFDPLGLWETDSYLGDVGKFYTGMGKAAGGLVVGVATSVVDLPKNLGTLAVGAYDNATDSNVRAEAGAMVSETGSAIKSAASDYGDKLASGDMETLGSATFHVLSVATPLAATKATAAADVAGIAGATARQTAAKVTESTLHTRGVRPAPGTRTLEGYVQQSAPKAEIGLYTKSQGFNTSSSSTQFKRFGADSHAGLSPHVHQPIRNPTPSGPRGVTGDKTKNGGVTKPSPKDVKQLYDHQKNGKYNE